MRDKGIPKAERRSALLLLLLCIVYLSSGGIIDKIMVREAPNSAPDSLILLLRKHLTTSERNGKEFNNSQNYINKEYHETSISSARKNERNSKSNKKEITTIKSIIINCREFDPQHVELSTLIEMGIPDRIAKNLVAYRNAGGKYDRIADLEKIYGMDDHLLGQLESCLTFGDSKFNQEAIIEKVSVIDLNSASEEELRSLPGIGDILSERIVKFRDRLGGFHSIDQLKETYGMSEENYAMAKEHLQIGEKPNCLSINELDTRELSRHPFLDYKLAKAIVAYRDQHGSFQNAEALSQLIALPPDTFEKIKPYLCF